MNNEIKRRVFLAGIVSFLVGVPVASLLIGRRNGGRGREGHLFSKELKKYRSLVDVPPTRIDAMTSAPCQFRVPLKQNWRYVIFSPSYLPSEYSLATGDDPDMFAVRDGNIFIEQNDHQQTYIYGGDSQFKLYSPTVIEDRSALEIALLAKENEIVPARMKGVTSTHQKDWLFYHQLTLKGFPHKEFKSGMKWTSKHCRIKPFGGFETSYEVTGFSKIGERNTVDIAFSGKIPNLVGMAGLTTQKLNPGDTTTNEHQGHAWFDLETGLLVRQVVEMETRCSSNAPNRRRHNRNDSKQNEGDTTTKSMLIKSNYVTQLFFG